MARTEPSAPPRARRRRGRPVGDGYRTPFARLAYKLGLLGLTNSELAQRFGVSDATFDRWKARHPDLRAALERAGEIADAKVARGLYKRGVGMWIKETKTSIDPRTGKPATTTYRKHLPPDPVAAMMWLTNRQRGRWRWKQRLELSADDNFKAFAELLRAAHKEIFDADFRVVGMAQLAHDHMANGISDTDATRQTADERP